MRVLRQLQPTIWGKLMATVASANMWGWGQRCSEGRISTESASVGSLASANVSAAATICVDRAGKSSIVPELEQSTYERLLDQIRVFRRRSRLHAGRVLDPNGLIGRWDTPGLNRPGSH